MQATQDNPCPYQDQTRPIAERVADLITRMTLEEKVTQLQHTSKAIPRLGIPEYDWWNECLHGVGRAGLATVFPQAIALAATFDQQLIHRIGEAISDEARAKYNAALKIGNRNRYRGLTFWSPNINIFRDPRWGRGQETYGEDPHLTSVMGVAFVKGLQGDDPRYLKVAACAKHFAVHSGPEKLRHSFDAVVSRKDLHETYLPAFKALVEAGVEIVMGAYNRTNGEPCCGSRFLLVELLRGKWQFKGHVVSDCWAIHDFHTNHKITSTPEESIALALRNGCDLNCGCIYESHYLLSALSKGLITEEQLNTALTNTLRTRFKLGMFDPPEAVPYSRLNDEVIDCAAHRKLAWEAAVKSIVLLKNKNNILPLDKNYQTIYVFGENAMDLEVLLGNYNGYSSRMVSIIEGIVAKSNRGASVILKQAKLPNQAAEVDQGFLSELGKADVFIAVLGITPRHEGEEGADAGETGGEGDRRDINLPPNQVSFINALAKIGIPLIVILTAGSQLVITGIMEAANAILYAWYPGEEGGNAVGDILFGNVSPAGRLPLTFPKSLSQVPDFTDYAMLNRTYRYMREEPLFPFGFGLSYTRFAYSELSLSAGSIKQGESITARVTVTNTGNRNSDEVVQLYLSRKDTAAATPICSLKAFRRISINAGASCRVDFIITPQDLQIINDQGEAVLEPGVITLTIGGAVPGQRSRELGAPVEVTADFRIC